jgi:formylglycine-generating enzyme required for sulfatase activity
MLAASTSLLAALRQAGLLPPDQLRQAERLAASLPSAEALAAALTERGLLTAYQAGELLAGRGAGLAVGSHVLLERLGEGGMGEVFRARHTVMGREVALKRILARRLDSPGAVERFLREVRAASILSHPNVVQVHDAGSAGGCHYLTMELLRGVDLAKYLSRRGPLPVCEAVEYVRQACVGLQHAHERGLVHRDLKPANLWLTQQRQVKILDLGLALLSDVGTMTKAGGFFGTVDYVAPEQVEDSHNVDVRADVYSLGCALYHLLAGKTPFDEAHPSARPMLHQSKEPVSLEARRPEVPAGVAEVVRKMMAKRREDRYQTPGDAARALAAVLTACPDAPRREGVAASPPPARTAELSTLPLPAQPPPDRAPTRRRWVPLLAGLLVAAVALPAVLCGVFAVLTSGRRPTKDDSSGATTQDSKGQGAEQKKKKKGFTNSIGMKLVRIPAARFWMGATDQERDAVWRARHEKEQEEWYQAEGPRHQVTIAKDFFMGIHEVTQKQYKDVMGTNPSCFCADGDGKDSVKGMGTDDFPVEKVSWDMARAFLRTLKELPKEQRERREYRLPTEAEWEYACRGGADVREPYSLKKPLDTLSSLQANFNGGWVFGDAEHGPYLKRTTRVGSYEPNAFGLYDMHGNVWEWCHDRYDAGAYRQKDRTHPHEPKGKLNRVLRGGSWFFDGRLCRSAFRQNAFPATGNYDYGFRVVCNVGED